MRVEVDLFGKEVPDKKIKEWAVPMPATLFKDIRERARRVRSTDTKHSSGGYQNMILDLEERIDHKGNMVVDYMTIGHVFRVAKTRGGGGWESDCSRILSLIAMFFLDECGDYGT